MNRVDGRGTHFCRRGPFSLTKISVRAAAEDTVRATHRSIWSLTTMRTLTAGWIVLSILFVAPIQAADWPQFRGPNRDDVSRERGLLQQWPEGGPPQKWLFREAGLG